MKRGSTAIVVGDGALGLLGALSAKQMGAERIIAMSFMPLARNQLTNFARLIIVTERGDEGVAEIKELAKGIGADSVLECVGTPESIRQAIRDSAAFRRLASAVGLGSMKGRSSVLINAAFAILSTNAFGSLALVGLNINLPSLRRLRNA